MSEASTARSAGPRSLPAPVSAGDQAARRRQLVLLGILGAVLLALVVYVVLPAIFSGTPTTAPARAAQSGPSGATARLQVVDVRLERLKAAPVAPVDGGRNPFRMGAATPPPGAAATAALAAAVTPRAMAPTGPPLPPPVPAIPFRFIGIVTSRGATSRIAVLSDGRNVVHGGEGGIVDGRYRIVKIGEESIQMEHLDGRGRQTIRLSGQTP